MEDEKRKTLGRNLSTGVWSVQALKQKDKRKKRNLALYDIFAVVYDDQDELVQNW